MTFFFFFGIVKPKSILKEFERMKRRNEERIERQKAEGYRGTAVAWYLEDDARSIRWEKLRHSYCA